MHKWIYIIPLPSWCRFWSWKTQSIPINTNTLISPRFSWVFVIALMKCTWHMLMVLRSLWTTSAWMKHFSSNVLDSLTADCIMYELDADTLLICFFVFGICLPLLFGDLLLLSTMRVLLMRVLGLSLPSGVTCAGLPNTSFFCFFSA